MAAWMTAERVDGWTASRSFPVMMRDTSRRSSISFVCARTLRSIDLEGPGGPLRIQPAGAQQTGPAQDGGQRRPQLVGERRQELVLHAVGFSRLRVDRVLDRDRAHLGELGQDTGILLAEVPLALLQHVEQAHGAAVAAGQRGCQPSHPARPVDGVVPVVFRDVDVARPPHRTADRREERDQRLAVAEHRPLSQSLVRLRQRRGAPRRRPFLVRGRDGHGLVDPEDVPGEVRDDLQGLSGRQRGVDREGGLGQPLELGGPMLQGLGLRLDLRRLLEELDEDRDLRLQDVGIDGRENVVDGAQGVSAGGVGVVRIRSDEDDRRVLGALSLPDQRRRLEPVHSGHVHVEQDHRELFLQEKAQGFPPRGRRQDVLVQVGQDGRERHQFAGVVVDRENVDAAFARRRVGRVQRHSQDRSTESIWSVSTGFAR